METESPDLFANIRTLLGLSASVVPDAMLRSDVLGPAAEREVLAWVGAPPYAERGPGDQAAIARAVVYLTAAWYVKANRARYALTGERFSGQYQWSGSTVDVDGWIGDLVSQARAAVGPLLPPPTPAQRQSHFRLAAGRRGQSPI